MHILSQSPSRRRPVKTLLLALLLTATAAFGGTRGEITITSVVAEMNVRRAAEGLPPLQLDPQLEAAAEDRMRDMEELGYWSHFAPDGRSPFDMLRKRAYPHAYAAENLAAGFETVRVLVDGWMESPGHRAAILSPLYKDCGVAIIDGSTTGRAVGKSVVVMFARRQIEHAAK
jgi:uncharacterized protein YkwD